MVFEVLLVLVLTTVHCTCLQTHHSFYVDSTFRDKMCSPTDVEFQIASRSVIDCVMSCTKDSFCRSLIFYHGNRTCYGLTTERPCAVFTDLPGAVFYKPAMGPVVGPTMAATATSAPVTNETNGCIAPMVVDVPYTMMTASSYCCGGYEAWNARLDNTRSWTGRRRSDEQLQVDFTTERSMTAIVTQGEYYYNEWVTSYNIHVSNDCVIFTALQTVFMGNFDRGTKITNLLNPPVSGRCVRIIPVTWVDRPSIRLEVLGCEL